jgi:Icc-related predicted phosphoesterase
MNKYSFLRLLFFSPILFAGWNGYAQEIDASNKLYFISDCQQPMKIEKLRLKSYRNEEARDSLFSDLVRQKPKNLFLIGDLTSAGSNNTSWKPIDNLLNILHQKHVLVNAIPGNHEYYRKAKKGIGNYRIRFPQSPLVGYCVKIDSMAVVMLNSNFSKMTTSEFHQQQLWYKAKMDSLERDNAIKAIVVCTHHAPYSNSKIVGSSKEVVLNFIPVFMNSSKARLFITGHSHNLEYFKRLPDKHFLVIGGGGGLTQPLWSFEKQLYPDVISQDQKPLYFYLILERNGDFISLNVRGMQKDFGSVRTFPVGRIN